VELLVHMSSKDGNDHDYIYPDLIFGKKINKYKNLKCLCHKFFFDSLVADKKLVNRFFNIFRFSLFIHEI
jgi:hypothetical protein